MIYLDNAATTKMAPEALEAMLPYLKDSYGNPGAVYSLGSAAKKAVNHSRRTIAGMLNAGADEIFFTSGGTESDNWAIKAVAETFSEKGKHIITTKIEHHAVLHTCEYLEKKGFEVTYLDVDEDGMVSTEELEKAIRPDTILISIMFANNEIGTIEPVAQIGAIARNHHILFHTDAVQAFGQIPIDVKAMNIDLLSASGHKFNGPKGIGFLYKTNSLRMDSFMHGGAQEREYRAGTENVPGIVGLEAAALRAQGMMQEKMRKETELRDYLIAKIEEKVSLCRLNGHRTNRLPGNVNFSFRFIEGESLLLLLDMQGICASGGSACTTGATDPSHVLKAIGRTENEMKGAIRLTLSEENTFEEMDYVVEKINEIIEKLRGVSVEYEKYTERMKLQ